MDGTAPTPPRKRKWAHRGGTCEKHGNACAMRRDVLDPDSVWTCVECEHEAGTLLAPQQDFEAQLETSTTAHTRPAGEVQDARVTDDAESPKATGHSLPPVPPPAAEPAHPPAQEPADDAVEGRGVVCSKAERVREMLTRWRNEDASINEAYARACELRDELDRALRRYDYGKLADDALGIELLRISNELATESKRLRGSERQADPLHPTGRCSCAGEGKCSWCRTHCFDCGVVLPCREHPGNNLPEQARAAEAERQRDVWKELHETMTAEWLRTQAAARDAGATIEALREIFNDYDAEEISASKAVERFRDLCTAVAERLRATEPAERKMTGAEFLEAFTGNLDQAAVAEYLEQREAEADVAPSGGADPDWIGANDPGRTRHCVPAPAPAMCAARGIDVRAYGPDGTRWSFTLPGDSYTTFGFDDADACVRAALEAFHALQQPAPVVVGYLDLTDKDAPSEPADDACVCTYRDDGHRDVSRFCTLHGAYWQTLAEQRSELHEDGTPRAGCGYCASTPELDARERGL